MQKKIKIENKKKGKKSRRRVSLWNRNKAKNARALGLEYISRSGKVIEKRKPGRPCTCKTKCFSKIIEDRTTLFDIFNNIADKEKQDTYLCGLFQIKDVTRKRPRSGVKLNLLLANFFLKIGTVEYNICKKAFISVYGITSSRVDRLTYFRNSNRPSPKDLRGKHSNQTNKIPENIINQLNDHIKCFSNEVIIAEDQMKTLHIYHRI